MFYGREEAVLAGYRELHEQDRSPAFSGRDSGILSLGVATVPPPAENHPDVVKWREVQSYFDTYGKWPSKGHPLYSFVENLRKFSKGRSEARPHDLVLSEARAAGLFKYN